MVPTHEARDCSPVNMVKKETSDPPWRVTVDLRNINFDLLPVQWPMPLLEEVVHQTRGHTYFGSCDAFAGYWQLPLHPDTMEILSVMTDKGVYKPTRLPQGSVDAVQWFHGQLSEIIADLISEKKVLQWIDDFCLHTNSLDELIDTWARFLNHMADHDIKLAPSKTHLYKRTVKFCGKILDGDGYHFDPSCMESLKHLELPTDAGQLNQLLCAMNWMRNVVPHYAELVDPLRQIMETIFAKRGNRRSNGLEKFQLRSFGWNETHNALLKGLVEKICEQMTLYYPDP